MLLSQGLIRHHRRPILFILSILFRSVLVAFPRSYLSEFAAASNSSSETLPVMV